MTRQDLAVVRGDYAKKRFLTAISALMLLAVLVAPVVAAAEPATESPSEGAALIQEGLVGLPEGENLTEGFERAEGEEESHAEWLASAEASQQREASRTAYAGLSAGEASELLLKAFPDQLQELNADPARVVSDAEIEEPLGEFTARVAQAGGGSAILESSVPVESDLSSGKSAPVDLALQEVAGGFAPANPLTEVRLPSAADGSIRLQEGITVTLPGNGNQEAEPIGDKNLFYPETQAATDTFVAPVSRGVDVFEQLRSPESPERFQFDLSLPDGASLQETSLGGAEIVSAAGQQLEEIPPPSAVDAQGTVVSVNLAVEGSSLVVNVVHRSEELAYPILLDPRYNEGYESPPFSGWTPTKNAEYLLSQSPSSLVAVSKGSFFNYPANTWGQWEYTAPGETAYIEQATFSNIYYIPHTCQTAQPHGYLGVYNVSTGAYNRLWVFSGGESYTPSEATGFLNSAYARKAIVGIGTGSSSSSLSCAHEIYVGGVTVQENDPEAPTVNSVSGIPSGWFDPEIAGSATVVATDPGFGVDLASIYDGGVTSEDRVGCTGMAGSRCPREVRWAITPPYKQGERTVQVTAEDPTGKVGTWSTTSKVDATKPEVNPHWPARPHHRRRRNPGQRKRSERKPAKPSCVQPPHQSDRRQQHEPDRKAIGRQEHRNLP